MKILITGATGLIGQVIAEKLKKNDHDVIALVRKTSKIEHLQKLGIQLATGDVTDYQSVMNASKGADIIIHCAAVIHPVNVKDNFYYNVNVNGTSNVAKAAVLNDVKQVLYCSSVTVYGKIKDESKPIPEETPCFGQNIYGKTKFIGEVVLKRDLKMRIPFTIFRIARVMGKGDNTMTPVYKLIKKGMFPIIGSGKTTMMPIDVEDVADAFILAIDNKKARNRTFNLSGQEVLTKKQFFRIIAEAMHAKNPWIHIPTPIAYLLAVTAELVYKPLNKDPPLSRKRIKFFLHNRKYNNEKIKNDLGFTPKVSIKQMIENTMNYYKGNNWI